MYSELYDVDVNHNEEVYVTPDETPLPLEERVDELPFRIPRD